MILNWTAISSAVAVASLTYSIYDGIVSRKIKKTVDKHQEKIAQMEHDETVEHNRFTKELSKINSSELLAPFFSLNLQNEDIYVNQDNVNFGINIRNVGRETAVNIQLWHDEGRAFITTRKSIDVYVGDYLDKDNAMVGESIKFRFITKKCEKFGDEFQFKIKYADIVGREYTQNFKFVYDNQFSPVGYTLNKVSYNPVIVKDVIK